MNSSRWVRKVNSAGNRVAAGLPEPRPGIYVPPSVWTVTDLVDMLGSGEWVMVESLDARGCAGWR